MGILKVIACLLDYPSQSLLSHRSEIEQVIGETTFLAESPGLGEDANKHYQEKLLHFVERHFQQDLLEWQSQYDELFERGRSLGLWLFEHVHGESRDRGQAMVDLMAQYREAGLEINQQELPDYIPLFLEFLSTQGRDNAASWLLDVEHILALLQCRLEKRGSDYALLFEVLLAMANSDIELDEVRERIAKEQRDDSKQAIDKEWEEEEVTFGADSLEKNCGGAQRKPAESQRQDLDSPVRLSM